MAATIGRNLSQSKSRFSVLVRTFSLSSHRPIGEGPNVYKVTHTGQVYDKDDYRNIRFVEKDKLINPNWAINLIAEDPVVVVEKNHVWSDSCGALGHPRVYINLDKPEIAVCGYSGRKFIQKKYYNEQIHGGSITYQEYLEQMKGDSR